MNDSQSNYTRNNPDNKLLPLDLGDLKEGLNFVFVGAFDNLQNLLKENKSNINFASRVNNYRTLTDGFIEESSVVIINKEEDYKILEIINFPNPNIDWLGSLEKYQTNYQNQEFDQELYKWGQIAKYDTEILCSNCGYIHSIEESYTYPICPACQSGLEDSPTDSDKAFWNNLS